MHILHFLNLSLVCSNLDNFTCTYHTFSTFSFSICSNCPSLYEARAHLFWRKTWFVWGIDMWQRNKLKVPGHHCNWPHIEGKTLVGRYSRHFCHVLPVKVDSGQSTNWTFHTLHRPANIEHWKTFDALIGCAGTVSLNFVTSSRGLLWRANNFLQNILGSKKKWCHQHPVVRVVPTRGLQKEPGELARSGRGQGQIGGVGEGALSKPIFCRWTFTFVLLVCDFIWFLWLWDQLWFENGPRRYRNCHQQQHIILII